ncbi:MAG: hypothetical protein V4510_06655 [bacterium]
MQLRLLLACTVLLAGCTIPSDTTTEKPVDASTYQIVVQWTISGVPGNSTFTFPMQVNSAAGIVTSSPHIGAHYWTSHQESPATSNAATPGCTHYKDGRQIPQDFDVTCTAPKAPGIYYLRGHVQETRGNQTYNWWSDEKSFTVNA